jgi:hypothetical protein
MNPAELCLVHVDPTYGTSLHFHFCPPDFLSKFEICAFAIGSTAARSVRPFSESDGELAVEAPLEPDSRETFATVCIGQDRFSACWCSGPMRISSGSSSTLDCKLGGFRKGNSA